MTRPAAFVLALLLVTAGAQAQVQYLPPTPELRDALNDLEAELQRGYPDVYPLLRANYVARIQRIYPQLYASPVDRAVALARWEWVQTVAEMQRTQSDCEPEARARKELADAARELLRCTDMVGDDCRREVRDVRDAGSELETAVGTCS